MGSIQIPNQKDRKWVRASHGEVFGNLYSTNNIDLRSNYGKARLSERTYRIFDSGDDADLYVPMDFVRTTADGTDRWWAVTRQNADYNILSSLGGNLFKSANSDPTSAWAQDTITDTPVNTLDSGIIFGENAISGVQRLVVSTRSGLAMLTDTGSGTVWDDNWDGTLGITIIGSQPVTLNTFINLLVVGNTNRISTVDDVLNSKNGRILLPKDMSIRWCVDDGRYLYFGCRNIGGEARVYAWDGTSDFINFHFGLRSEDTYWGVIKNGVLYALNSRGQLLRFNGEGMDEVAALPISDSEYEWEKITGSGGNVDGTQARPSRQKSVDVIDDEILFLMRGSFGTVGSTYTKILSNMPSGIWAYNEENGLYCKHVVGAYDGSTNDDWGAPIIQYAGGLKATNDSQGRFLIGAQVFTDDHTTSLPTIQVGKGASTTDQRGNFSTPLLSADSTRAFFQELRTVFKEFENSTDRIVLKYRTQKDKNFDDVITNVYDIVWSDTDTFTTTDSDFANVAVGNEIEVLCGKGAGALAHVSSISEAGGTYTVNLDEAIPNVSGDATVRAQNFIKLGTIDDQSVQDEIYAIASQGAWVQLKLELRGTQRSPEVAKLILDFDEQDV